MKDIGMSRTTKIVVAVGAAFAALVLVVVVLVAASRTRGPARSGFSTR